MKLGQWDTNAVYNVDALELLKGLPDGSVDLVVTSPPYNMGTNLNGATPCSNSASNWGRSVLLSAGYDVHSDAMPHEEYVQWQRQIISECLRVLPDTGAIFYNHKWRIQSGLLDMRAEIVEGFPVRQIIIWNRGSGNNHNPAFFAPEYEVIYLIAKPKFYLSKRRIHYGDVWNIPMEKKNAHPAPFPVALAERCILSTDAELVLDPFLGSGTTAIAAQKNGRDYIGSDLSPAYCELARKRLALPYMTSLFEATP